MGRVQQSSQAAPASEALLALSPPRAPEDRLMLAVLLDALAVLREHATGVCPHEQELVDTTVRWFLVQHEAWPFSFANVCQGLGLDPVRMLADVRTEVAELGAPALLRPPRQRVVTLTLVHSVPGDGAARSNRNR